MADSSIDLGGVNLWYVGEKTLADLVSTNGVRFNKKESCPYPALSVLPSSDQNATGLMWELNLHVSGSSNQTDIVSCQTWNEALVFTGRTCEASAMFRAQQGVLEMG